MINPRKTRILSLLLAVAITLSAVLVGNVIAKAWSEVSVSILHDGKQINSLQLEQDGEVVISASIDGAEAESYRWQILTDESSGTYVTIGDRRAVDCKVNFALVKSNLNSIATAYLRCVVNDGSREHYSQPVAVEITFKVPEPTAQSSRTATDTADNVPTATPKLRARMAARSSCDDSLHTHEITVKYLIAGSGNPAWEPERFSVQHGSSLERNVTLPTVVGYTPSYTSSGETGGSIDVSAGIFKIDLTDISSDVVYTVYYNPGLTEYKIVHHLQNLDTEGYDSNPITEVKKGLTGTLITGDLHKSGDPKSSNYDVRMVGFSYLAYRHLVIAADGQTTIHIYYNRDYYVVEYDYSGGGYGVESIAVRYGTEIISRSATRPGWDFGGWELVGCRAGAVDPDTMKPTMVAPTAEQLDTFDLNKGRITVPNFDLKYRPVWIQGDSSFTVVYWREVANSTGEQTEYEFWGSKVYGYEVLTDGSYWYNGDVVTGSVITPDTNVPGSKTVSYKDVPSDISTIVSYGASVDESQYFKYNEQKTQSMITEDIVVEGDGTSVLNIYYDRQEYNLKFYYAASSGNNNKTYYVVGGSTYYFGSLASNNTSDDAALFSQYLSGRVTDQRGTVNTLPTLKNGVAQERGYSLGEITQGSYTMYYISFKAKYGADISKQWPVDAFNSVERTSAGNNGGWTGRDAYVSAWNGEHNVYYSEKYSNETIKGKYNKLDYRILWDKSISGVNTLADETERTLTFTDGSTSYAEGGTVAYLCFWENGAAVNWSVPKLFRYNIWTECVDQSNPDSGAVQHTYRDSTTGQNVTKWYALHESYDTVDDSNVNNQTDPPLHGFQFVDRVGTSMSSGEYSSSYNVQSATKVDFYYNREIYNLKFNNNGKYLPNKDANGNDVDHLGIRYGVSLYVDNPDGYNLGKIYGSDGKLRFYPENLEAGAYEFVDWHYAPSFAKGSEVVFTSDTKMPAHDVEIYAHWAKKTHKVYVYNTKADFVANNPLYPGRAPSVLHGDLSPTPADPQPLENGDAFAGWYYLDSETGAEKRFFFSMPVTQEMHIYAKYQSNVAVEYTIYFAALDHYDSLGNPVARRDSSGNIIYVADERVAWAVAGTDVTVYAKSDEELYPEYRTGWFPEPISQDLSLSVNGDNVKTVYYSERETVPYRVEYVYSTGDPVLGYFNDDGEAVLDGTEPLIKEKLDNKHTVVTENFVPVHGYLPDLLQKRLVLSSVAPDEGEAVADENVLTFVYSISENKTLVQVIEYVETLTENNYTELSNKTYENGISQPFAYDIKSLAGFDFNGQKTVINSVSTPTAAGLTQIAVAEVTADGLLIEVYYDRKHVDYEIRHEIIDANQNVLEVRDTRKDTGIHGATVLASANTYAGYSLVSNNAYREMTLNGQYDTSGENPNVIVFQYSESTVRIHYLAVGDENVQQSWISSSGGNVKAFADSVDATGGCIPYGTDITKTDDGKLYRFDGWYLNEACTLAANSTWISDDNRLTPQRVGNIFTETTYYAKFVPALANLTIKTDFLTQQGIYSSLEPNKTWIFHIKGTSADTSQIDINVTVHGKGSVTVAELPIGDYTVEELTDWTWRYDMKSRERQVTLTSDGRTETFVPLRNREYWLDGHSYDVNIFNGTGHN